MGLYGEEGMECKVLVNGTQLEHLSEFKYLNCVLNESDTDGTRMAFGRKIPVSIRSLVNVRGL